jgi:hypothetical protein
MVKTSFMFGSNTPELNGGGFVINVKSPGFRHGTLASETMISFTEVIASVFWRMRSPKLLNNLKRG